VNDFARILVPLYQSIAQCMQVKVKLPVFHEDMSGGIARTYLTSAVDGGEWSASCPGCLDSNERAPGIGGLGSQMSGCCGLEKNALPLLEIELSHPPHSLSLYRLFYPAVLR
jgi:hypothetical protein